MEKFFGCNGQAFISKEQKDLSGKSIPFVLKWYRKMSILDNLKSQPNVDNQPSYLSTLLLVSFFELKWWNFLVAMARHLSEKGEKICQRKAFRSFQNDTERWVFKISRIPAYMLTWSLYDDVPTKIFWVKYSSNTEIDTSTSSKYLLAHEMSHLRSWPIILALKYCRKIPMVICTLYVHITMVDFKYKKIVLLVE